jgi:hypothetical protein
MRSVLYDRYIFHESSQKEDEPFADYLVRVKKISEHCKFDQVTPETMLRDRIIFVIRDEDLLRKFLEEDESKLKLENVIKKCDISDATEKRVQKTHIYKFQFFVDFNFLAIPTVK